MSYEGYKLNEKTMGNIKSMLEKKGYFTEKEYVKAFSIFEKLINITDEQSDFDEHYGNQLDDIIYEEIDIYSGCKLKAFLEKINRLKNAENAENTDATITNDIVLRDYYEKLGFFDWLKKENIKNDDGFTCEKLKNNLEEAEFCIENIEVSKYENCQYYIAEYIMAYQLENESKGKDTLIQVEDIDNKKLISLLVVYLDQCLKNEKIIEEAYKKEALNCIDYVGFANKQIESAKDYEEFDKFFVELNWKDDLEEKPFDGYKKSIKYKGEAGQGKTTQMRKVFFDLLKEIVEGKKECLPIWIDLWSLNEEKESVLEDKIKEVLGEYAQYYEVLLSDSNNADSKIREYSKLMLFLDGFNEIIDVDVKTTVGKVVNAMHKNYPYLFIAMTDRLMKSTITCLDRNVKVFEYKCMEMEDAEKYIDKKTEKVLEEDEEYNPNIENPEWIEKFKSYAKDYINGADWFINIGIIPAKLNSLIRLLAENIEPNSKDDFYGSYVEFILDREQNLKNDYRVRKLRKALRILAFKINDPKGSMIREDITDLWSESEKLKPFTKNDEVEMLMDLAIQLPILVLENGKYKFLHTKYFHYFKAGIWP